MREQSNDIILELRDVSFRYPDGSVGLAGCSLTVHRGSLTVLLGANGAGKTTLFQHLNGILKPKTGTVLFDGSPIDYGRQCLYRLRSRVGIVFQNPDSQLFSASVREDVSFGPLNLQLDNDTVCARVEEALQMVKMTEFADKPVHNLSYGQKKRVCIAGVLAMYPEVLILDEPMAGLDFQMQHELMSILNKLHSEGMTIIIATHDIDFAWQWSDAMVILAKGRCKEIFKTEDILNNFQRLADLDIGIPKTARLFHTLMELEILPKNAPQPRTIEDLIRQISMHNTGD